MDKLLRPYASNGTIKEYEGIYNIKSTPCNGTCAFLTKYKI